MVRRRGRSRQRPSQARRAPLNYYRSGRPETPPAAAPKAKAGFKAATGRLVRRAGELAALLIILGLLVYSMIIKPQPKLELSSDIYRPASVYQQAAAVELRKLKNRTKISLDEGALIAALQKLFPEIAGGSVKLPLFGQTPLIKLEIGRPTFSLTSAGQTYLVNNYGMVVGLAADYPETKKLPAVIDQTAYKVESGKQALSSSGVAFINSLVLQLQRAKVKIDKIILPPRPQELNLRETGRGYFVKFYLGGEPLPQIGQYLATRRHFIKNGITPRDYLDARVAGKVYYK